MKRALLSVSDKTDIVDFGQALSRRGWHLLSTGGTAATLREAGLDVTEVADAAKAYVAATRPRMPEGVALTIWQDDTRLLKSRLDTLLKNGRAGLFLVLLVLTLFLRLRLAFWATILAAIIGLVMTFNRLQVEVTPGAVVMSFGWGWPRKTIQRSDIVAHHVVRHSPLLGWGIRWFKGGTMWNVWGLDAVELQLDTGRKFRIGTDDPAGLDAALSR